MSEGNAPLGLPSLGLPSLCLLIWESTSLRLHYILHRSSLGLLSFGLHEHRWPITNSKPKEILKCYTVLKIVISENRSGEKIYFITFSDNPFM